MDVKLNSVKKGSAYHHGDLRDAMLDAAEAVIGERGIDGFSSRECARRAGVSPAAPAHHFGDARGLLTALAARAFAALTQALDAVPADAEPAEGLRALGRAYVAFAFDRPALFDLMWRRARLDWEDATLVAAADRAFDPLVGAVARAVGGEPDRADIVAAWAMVHGFARLALDGAIPADTLPPIDAVLHRLRV